MLSDFVEFVWNFIITVLGIIAIALIVASLIAFIAGIMQGGYLLKSRLDNSWGVVYCDGSELYEGRLYRISKELETTNLQSPMFTVKLRGEKNFFDIHKKAFCKDLKIKGE